MKNSVTSSMTSNVYIYISLYQPQWSIVLNKAINIYMYTLMGVWELFDMDNNLNMVGV